MARTRWRPPRPSRSWVAPLAAGAGWLAFAWFLVHQARVGPAIIWSDSKAYEAVARRPLWSSGFWMAQRPPLTPLLIKLAGSSSGFLLAQAVIGAVAWGILAWTVGRLATPGWRRVLAVWLILGFATTLPVTLWNRSVLSESLALSVLALVTAATIAVARRLTWPRIAALTASCLCFAASRDAQVWTVALLGLVAAGCAVAQLTRGRHAAVRAGALAGCLLVVAVLTGSGTVASHRTTANVADVFDVRIFPFPGRVAWFAGHGMPDASQIDAAARGARPQPGGAKVVSLPTGESSFAPLRHWMTTRASTVYALWLVTHPWYVVTEPLDRPEQAYNYAQGNLYFYAATTDQMRSPLTEVLWPPLLEFLIVAALALYLAVLSGSWRQRAWWAVLGLGVIGVLSMLVAWHGDGQEVTRHTVEGFAELRLSVWILVVMGLLGPSSVSERRRASQSPAEGQAPTTPGSPVSASP